MKLKKEFDKYSDLYKNGYRFNPDEGCFYTCDPKKFVVPEGYDHWEVKKFDPKEYLNERLKELGISEKENMIELIDQKGSRSKSLEKFPVFTANEFGDIEILQYSLKRNPYTYETSRTSSGVREQYRIQKRLHPISEAICEGKYDFSEGINAPFWHKSLVDAFQEGHEVKELVITEGQFKAFKASMDGIPTVGLTSISHFRDSKVDKIHPEIVEFIRVCKVQKVLILWDADCRDISTKQLERGQDLGTRPNGFYKHAISIRDYLKEFFPGDNKLQVFFGTIIKRGGDNPPKGIDDLLIELKTVSEVKNDILSLGEIPGRFIYSENITKASAAKKLYSWFQLSKVSEFYQFHIDKIRHNKFVFLHNSYQILEGRPVIEISKDLKNYIRVGDNYYEKINKPFLSPNNTIIYEETLVPRSKQTIIDDYGKDSYTHVIKFKDFVNIANHIEYQPVIDNCYNLYNELNHDPKEGNWPHIEMLLKHVFQEQYTMILDYITVLYRKPLQKLPVICLVSKMQKTGKSTFVYLMKLIFKNNMMMIDNQDFLEPFNDHWITKLVVACEETIFDKRDAYEKIKRLTTGAYINRKEKNKNAVQISNMLHFIFCSNYEDDFIKIDDHDSRLWIRKVGEIAEQVDNFEQKLEDELDCFVNYIINREIQYDDKVDRLFFLPKYFKTEAFYNIVRNSEPVIIKEIREHLTDNFLKFAGETREMTAKDLQRHYGIRGDIPFLNKMINQYLKPDRTTNAKGETYVTTYSFIIEDSSDPTQSKVEKGKGRPFVFHAKNFLTPTQYEELITATPAELPF